MSRPSLPFDLVDDHIRITRWDDPLVDAHGHDPRSPYVERFWLSLLGPSTTFLARRLATDLERHPDGFDLPLEDTARALGLGIREGTRSPFYRALARLGQFHISRGAGPMALSVRVRLQTLTRHQIDRLPPTLRDEHEQWAASAHAAPSVEQRRTHARRLALSLLELGETEEACELQLHRWKVHPALAHEAMRWARARRAGIAPGVPGAAVNGASTAAANGVAPVVPNGATSGAVNRAMPGAATDTSSGTVSAAANGQAPAAPAPPRRPTPPRPRPSTVFDPADDAA